MLPLEVRFFCILIVPTLRVGMPLGTLRVPAREFDAERQGLHSFAARGNDQSAILQLDVIQRLIHRQFAQHDDLCDAQCCLAV
ncbi:hypothetical protein EJA71_20255 [Pseudomonas sp. PB106]|nr:hypothetical protein EJA71_20255 [Pseudomonas sp. PB106]